MRIHTNILTYDDIRSALDAERWTGRIAPHVTFKTLSQHGSRTAGRSFEIQLEAGRRDRGRRAGNSGSYGAMRPEYDGYAATFDEWGWLLAALYKLDPEMIVGTGKHPVYRDAEDFDHRTAWSYNPERWLSYVLEWPTFADERDPFPVVIGNAARTKRGWFVGRYGANRLSIEDTRPGWGLDKPRTVASFVEHARITPEQLDAFKRTALTAV